MYLYLCLSPHLSVDLFLSRQPLCCYLMLSPPLSFSASACICLSFMHMYLLLRVYVFFSCLFHPVYFMCM